MATYSYSAISNDGNKVKDFIVATNQETALQKLSSQGLFVIEIKEGEPQTNLLDIKLSLFRGVSEETLSTFLMQLAIMIKCGISLAEALNSMEQSEENPKFKDIINDIRTKVFNGQPFSDALASHPDLWDNFTVSMIRIGESGGMLEHVLKKLTENNKRKNALKSQIIGALAYPSVLVVVTIIVLIVLFVYAIPQFATLFSKSGMALPLSTRLLIQFGDFMQVHYIKVLAVLGCLFFSTIIFLFTESGRKFFTDLSLYIPVIKQVTKRYYIVQIAETMGLLLTANVPLRELIIAIKETIIAETPRKELDFLNEEISKGNTIHDSLKNSKIFPPMAVKLIETGETTGSLDTMLREISAYYDEQLQTALKSALSMLEPLLLATMACIVGFIVMSVMVPLFKMSLMKPV